MPIIDVLTKKSLEIPIINIHIYSKVDWRAEDEGPVSAKVGIGYVGSKNRREEDGPNPVGNVIGRGHCALV